MKPEVGVLTDSVESGDWSVESLIVVTVDHSRCALGNYGNQDRSFVSNSNDHSGDIEGGELVCVACGDELERSSV